MWPKLLHVVFDDLNELLHDGGGFIVHSLRILQPLVSLLVIFEQFVVGKGNVSRECGAIAVKVQFRLLKREVIKQLILVIFDVLEGLQDTQRGVDHSVVLSHVVQRLPQ